MALAGTTYIWIEYQGLDVIARPGDLLIVYKEGARYQQINDMNGDPVTHIAMLAVLDGVVITLEQGPAGFFSRTFDELDPNYLGLAVVHLDLDDARRALVIEAARAALREQPFRYTHAQCVGIGLYALTRRIAPRTLEPVITAIVLAIASIAYILHGGRRTTCSGALAQVFTAVGVPLVLAVPSRVPIAHRDRGDLGALRLRPRRLVAQRWRGPWTVLASPSDLAVTVPSTGISVVRAVPGRDRDAAVSVAA